jgi:predicted metal-dependent HD superfamily phosphohydrolase
MATPFLKMCSHYWDELMSFCQVANITARERELAHLIASYGEPHRYYHNLGHVIYVLDGLLESSMEAKILPREERANVRLAAWFHDIVYDTRRQDNEERSAERAATSLRALGLEENCVKRVGDLICMTKNHHAADGDLAAWWFIDADLSILGGAPEDYQNYVAGVRKEYAWVPDHEFYPKRRAILQGFLDRPTIFMTAEHRRWEEPEARANIAGEIALIDEILKTLPS